MESDRAKYDDHLLTCARDLAKLKHQTTGANHAARARPPFHSPENMAGGGGGGLHLKPPTYEHIFEAVITFSPFLLYRYF